MHLTSFLFYRSHMYLCRKRKHLISEKLQSSAQKIYYCTRYLEPTLDFVGEMLRAADDAGHELSPHVHDHVRSLGTGKALEAIRGSYSHHML